MRALAPVSLCVVLASAGCSDRVVREFESPFSTSALTEVLALGAEARFEVLDAAGKPVSFALLSFVWDEGGRAAFQCDENGALWLRVGDGPGLGAATVRVYRVAPGHVFVGEHLERVARPLDRGRVRVVASR